MFTIIDSTTGKVLFAKFGNEVLEGQTAIIAMLTEPIPDGMTAYWNFETQQFYLQND